MVKKSLRMYRQGDVLLVELDKPMESGKTASIENQEATLAYGEVTGHRHALHGGSICLYRDDGNARPCAVDLPGSAMPLKHEEHDTIALPAGLYDLPLQVQESADAKPVVVAD